MNAVDFGSISKQIQNPILDRLLGTAAQIPQRVEALQALAKTDDDLFDALGELCVMPET